MNIISFKTKYGRFLFPGLVTLGTLLVGIFAGYAQTGGKEDDVAALKKYLSQPPCISRLVYSEIPVDAKQKGRTYVAAFSEEGFYMREIKPGENYDVPISSSNRMRSSLLVGRYHDTSWQINGFNVAATIDPNPKQSDRYTVFAENQKTLLQEVVTLGSQEIKPGSAVWNGDKFQAVPSSFMRQMFPDKKLLNGEAKVADGRIVEMQIESSGMWDYEYEDSPKRPRWFPARIWPFGPGHVRRQGFFIQEIVLSENNDLTNKFLPTAHIAQDVALLTVVSNNQAVHSFDSEDPGVIAIVRKEMSPIAKNHNRKTIAWIGFATIIVIIIGITGYRNMRKRK
jgi:hypothetical protein